MDTSSAGPEGSSYVEVETRSQLEAGGDRRCSSGSQVARIATGGLSGAASKRLTSSPIMVEISD